MRFPRRSPLSIASDGEPQARDRTPSYRKSGGEVGPCGGYEGSASTMPAATVFDVASSIRMKLPVVRLRA